MRLIFEEDIEHSDFLEVVISQEDLEKILEGGIVKDFPRGLNKNKNLNIYLRFDHATSERESSQEQEGILREYQKRDGSRQTTKASGSDRIQRSAKRQKKEG